MSDTSDNRRVKPNKFKVGDIVLSQHGVKHTVVKVIYSHKGHRYLISTGYYETMVEETDISFYYKEHDTPPRFRACRDFSDRDTCPRCGNPFHVSGFGATKWKDCLKCNRKAEDM